MRSAARSDVQEIRVPLQVIEHVREELQDLPGALVAHLEKSRLAPAPPHFLRPAPRRGDGGPGHERGDPRASEPRREWRVRRRGNAHDTDRTGSRNAERAGIESTQHPAEISELGAEGVVAESLGPDELSGVVDTRAAGVPAHHHVPRARQALGQRRKESPVLESLEAVTEHDGRPGDPAVAGPHIDEDFSERCHRADDG